ncbi:MAG: hypothetical protein BroJett011_11230 [Chloroflexota bacterium]|nr:MAG: hypothetical protein BroJett011_11230 [Chloroflexota bacterium]
MKRLLSLFFVIFFITCLPPLSKVSVFAETSPAAPSPTATPPPLPVTPQPAVAASKRADPIFVFEVGSVVMEKANGLAVANGLAYVSSEVGLHVLDLSNPAVPRQIGLYPVEWSIMSTPPGEIAVAGPMAYLLVAGGVHMVDVSDPGAPRQVGLYQPGVGIEHIAVTDKTLYLGAGPEFLVVDVSNPASPQELTRLSLGWVNQIVVAGTTAYVVAANQIAELHIFDISDPAAPRQVGRYQTSSPVTAVAVAPAPPAQAGVVAYVITQEGLHLVDVSDPARPKDMSSYAASGGGYSLAVTGNTAYIASRGATGYGGLSVMDVSNPAAPRELGFVNVADASWWESRVAVSETGDRVDVYVLATPGGALFAFPEVKTALSRPLPQTASAPLPVTPVELPSPEPVTVWTYYPLPRELGYLGAITLDPRGRVWGTGPVGLHLLEVDESTGAATWTTYKLSGLPDILGLGSLVVDDQGRIWAGASKGKGSTWEGAVVSFDGSAWTSYTSADGLSGSTVHTLVIDKGGQVWAGTDGGVSRFDGQAWTRLEGAPVPARAIAFDPAGRVWVGSNVGVSVFDGADWTAYPKAGDFEMQFVNGIDFDPAGNVWVAFGGWVDMECSNTGLGKFDGQTWTTYLATLFRNFCNDGPPMALAFDQAGNGWVGMRDNIKNFDPQTLPAGANLYNEEVWTEYYDGNYERGAASAGFVMLDQAGNTWFKGFHGISRLAASPLAGLNVAAPRTYKDPALGFSLEYDPTWQLETQNGADRIILLKKEGYQFQMQIQHRPPVSGACDGLLEPAQLTLYWKYPLGASEIWRAKAEAGWVNGYNDDQHSFIDVIVPTELWDKPDPNGAIGKYTCAPQINDYVIKMSYLLPVSVEDLKTGHFKPERLAELDYILTSLAWK